MASGPPVRTIQPVGVQPQPMQPPMSRPRMGAERFSPMGGQPQFSGPQLGQALQQPAPQAPSMDWGMGNRFNPAPTPLPVATKPQVAPMIQPVRRPNGYPATEY